MTKQKVKIKDNLYDKKISEPEEYIFENVFQLKDNEWTTVMTGEQLGQMWLDNSILYDKDCQRGVTLKRDSNGELIERAVYSAKNIKEIQDEITAGKYHPDEITLNILKDGRDEIFVTGDEMIAKGILLVSDGQHRLKALSNILSSYRLLKRECTILQDLSFSVKITNYTEEQAGLLFYQLTKGLKISRSRAESFNKKNSINKIVLDLNKTGVLKDKIDIVKTSIHVRNNFHITTFSTMVTAIRDSYGRIDDEDMEKELNDFLQAFFKELTTIFPEILNDDERQLSKKYDMVAENFMMYGWIELSQMLYCYRFNGDKWKHQLRNISKINFSKIVDKNINPIWRPVLREGENGSPHIINSKSTRQVLRRILKEQFYMAQN